MSIMQIYRINIKNNMSNIYIVFTKTNTKLGWIIRKFTKYKYNHVFITQSMYLPGYSFGRKYYKLPFVGGLVEEDLNRILYPKKEAKIKIYKIPLNKEQEKYYEEFIDEIKSPKNMFIYNNLTAINLMARKNIDVYNAYTCVTFVMKILIKLNIQLTNYVEDSEINFITPERLDELLNKYNYKEMIINMNSELFNNSSPSNYLKKFTILQKIKINLGYIHLLFKRIKLS